MIFIDAQGKTATHFDLILDIVDLLEFDEIRSIKKLTSQSKHQVGIFCATKPVCFINFTDEQSRDEGYGAFVTAFPNVKHTYSPEFHSPRRNNSSAYI